MESARKLFIENITRHRERLNLTQSQAAEGIGVTLGTYQKYEYGTAFPSPEKIDEIAKTFMVPISDLYADPSSKIEVQDLRNDRASRILNVQDRLKKLSDNQLTDLEDSLDQIELNSGPTDISSHLKSK